jgi:hypothetical protein
MQKKIAIVVRDRQDEALRMAVGAILADDTIEVYVLDRKVAESEDNTMNLEMMEELDFKICTNFQGNEGMQLLSNEEIARNLLEYDHVVAY